MVVSASTDGRMPDREMQALGPRGLGDRAQPELLEQVAQLDAPRGAVDDGGGRAGVEVEHDRGGVPRVGRPRLGVCSSSAARLAVHTRPATSSIEHAGDVGVGVERHRVEPLGPMAGAALLEEPLAVDAVGQAHHGDRPVAQVGQHGRGDPGVVVDHLAFGEAGGRVQHLVEVGEA